MATNKSRESPSDVRKSEVSPTAGPSLRILLAEDIPPNQKLAATILQLRGHTVTVANNGREAVDRIAHAEFDLVLMDVQMPEMDGFEATAAIRAMQRRDGRRLPIIAMTAHALQEDFDRCLAAGMDGYISKPIKAAEMIALVERLAQEHHAPTAHQQAGRTRKPAGPTEEAVGQTFLPATTDEPAAPSETFDLADAMRRCFDRQMFCGMVEFYFSEWAELLEQIRTGIVDGNAAKIAKAAHRLRGTVAYLGSRATLSAIKRVEQSAASRDWPAAAAAAEQLHTEANRLAGALAPHRQPVTAVSSS